MKNLGLLTLCAGLIVSGSPGAQDAPSRGGTHYPERSVRMVVGFTAGGPTDVIARIIAERLSTSFHLDPALDEVGNVPALLIGQQVGFMREVWCRHIWQAVFGGPRPIFVAE